MDKLVAHRFFKKHVKDTERHAYVVIEEVILCSLTKAVSITIGISSSKAYLSSRAVKHVYDKRPAQEFDMLIQNLPSIVKYPDCIYKNKNAKRGSFCFVKNIRGILYLCSLEQAELEGESVLQVATFFRTTEDYLKNYELLWEWKGGTPSS
ncbi:MAG: hypothetical protein JWM20_144 [Patescibacteria group bacterium]|nr:hypothetical protein [Patescibacteria group bacterium]